MADKVKALHLGQIHKPNDRRIWEKECGSLISSGKYEVVYYTSDKYRNSSSDSRIKFHSMQRSAFYSRGHLRQSIEELNYIICTENPRIIHFHEYEIAYLIPYIKKRYPSIKIIYDVHENNSGYYFEKYESQFGRIVGKVIEAVVRAKDDYYAKKSDAVITVADYLVGRFSKMTKTTLVGNYPILETCIDDDFEKRDGSHVCYIGGIGYDKGGSLCRVVHDIHGKITIAGPIYDEQFHSFLNQVLAGNKNIEYVGVLPPEQVKPLLEKSGIGYCVFQKTPNNYNANPNKLFEYMMAGLPVVCSDFPAWKEIIAGSKCGITVNPEDEDEIAKAINYLISHPKEAREMGQNGRRAVEEIYNWDNEAKKLLQIYNELVI